MRLGLRNLEHPSDRHTTMHMFVGVVAVSLVVASCGGADGTESNSTPTTAVAPGDTLGEPGSPSVEACGLSDPWGMVETAFVGTVAAVTTRDRISQEAIDGRAASGGEWPWVSFEVDGWYTKDFGTDFSMWAPGFAGRVGERWQIAGALYFVDGEVGRGIPLCFDRRDDRRSGGLGRSVWGQRRCRQRDAGATGRSATRCKYRRTRADLGAAPTE